MTQCSNANNKNEIVVTFHLISYRPMMKLNWKKKSNNLLVARLLAHIDLHSRHGGGGGGGAIFLKQYEQRINDPLHRKEK